LEPTWADYRVPLLDKITVLDALFYVVQNVDSTVSFRCACRAAMCGSCGMVMNGREGLACRIQLAGLGKMVRVEPMRNMPVIKDLAVDMEPFFDKYQAVTPYIVPRDNSQEPAVIPPGSTLRDLIDDHLDCITCGACYSACSIVASDPSYLGPAALPCLLLDGRCAGRGARAAASGGQRSARCLALPFTVRVHPGLSEEPGPDSSDQEAEAR
jgi:succinate dehydrogenase/fumarate reductase iron-sulfur protein